MLLRSSIITLTIVFISVPTSSLPLDRDLTARSVKCSDACYMLCNPVCGQSKSGDYESFDIECFFNKYNICHPQDLCTLVKVDFCKK